MKHGVLTSIAHNIADSLASGVGLMIGVYAMDVFGEAARTRRGYVDVDFLAGRLHGVAPWRGRSLARAVSLYAKALPDLASRQGASAADFRRLVVRYAVRPNRHFMVEVTDSRGRTSRDVYLGLPGARPKVLDPQGRIRRRTGT